MSSSRKIINRTGKAVFVIVAVAIVAGIVLISSFQAGARTTAPELVPKDDFIAPRIIGGTCGDGVVVGVLSAAEAGAYSLREVYKDGSTSLPLTPATQGKMGDKLALDGPWLDYGESYTFLIAVAGYDDGATPVVLTEETISRPTRAQCETAGFDTEDIYGTL